jgi:hypothetical protein
MEFSAASRLFSSKSGPHSSGNVSTVAMLTVDPTSFLLAVLKSQPLPRPLSQGIQTYAC